MIIITYYILDFEQAPNCITNMPKRSALEAGLKDLVTPSGKKVRDLLKSVRKRSTSVEVETDDILFLSPLNQVRYNAAEKVDGDKNITLRDPKNHLLVRQSGNIDFIELENVGGEKIYSANSITFKFNSAVSSLPEFEFIGYNSRNTSFSVFAIRVNILSF